jgi:hypothetical protein
LTTLPACGHAQIQPKYGQSPGRGSAPATDVLTHITQGEEVRSENRGYLNAS